VGGFKGVESVLTDDTKLEIAVWLVGVKAIGPKIEPWPDTFAKCLIGSSEINTSLGNASGAQQ
jgi:hypothetical protein